MEIGGQGCAKLWMGVQKRFERTLACLRRQAKNDKDGAPSADAQKSQNPHPEESGVRHPR